MSKIDSIYKELKELETDDYQNRNGEYIKSGIPENIEVYKYEDRVEVMVLFKNTNEETCIKWLKNKFKSYKISEVEAWQDGDYHDDWVQSMIKVVG